MKQIKVSELPGAALDYCVAQCEGCAGHDSEGYLQWPDNYSSDWSKGGPIIEREATVAAGRLTIKNKTYATQKEGQTFMASYDGHNWESVPAMYGPTMLIAAMRCYVASKLGNVVEIPDEMC